ncbi:MAG: ribonuclease HI family protein [Deltaproteobacteria bacterium]|nr:ribonuclease HI family protein [Deltaproteobacteria bacterium]
MPRKAWDRDLVNRFLEELSLTLDIQKTIKKVGLTEDDARSIFASLMTRKKPGAIKDLFEETVSQPKEAVRPKKAAHKGAHILNVDGASRGNPGLAGAGAVIRDSEGTVLKKLKRFLGVTTNNMAEYKALLMGLESAKDIGATDIEVLADSELMVRQVNGIYKVKSEELRPLYEKAIGLLKGFKSSKVRHIYRQENSIADSLANEAIDGRKE